MSQHEEAIYFDTDTELFQKLTFDKTDRPWFGSDEHGVDEWLAYHKGQQDFFKQYHTCPILDPTNHYQISGDAKFIHHRFTMRKFDK
jgi:hypothetical protein